MRLSIARTAVSLILASVVAAVGAETALAAAAPQPVAVLRTSHRFPHGYMEYTAAPGQTLRDTVTVEDVGTGPGDFPLFAADGLTSPLTGVVYASRQAPFPDGPSGNGEYGAGQWISLQATAVHLMPGQNVSVGFSVTVPPGTAPGDHVGALSVEAPPSTQSSGELGLRVSTLSTVAVVIHVPGAVRTAGVAIGSPYVTVENRTRQILNIPLTYSGDVLVQPFIDLKVLDARGRTILSMDRRFDTFVPHSTIIFPYPIDTLVLSPGSYRLVADFGPAGAEQHFERVFRVGAAQAQVPPPSQRGKPPVVAAGAVDAVSPSVLAAMLALMLALATPLLLRYRRRCAHCGRHGLHGFRTIAEAMDVWSCQTCRSALRARRGAISLCAGCMRRHTLARTEVLRGTATHQPVGSRSR